MTKYAFLEVVSLFLVPLFAAPTIAAQEMTTSTLTKSMGTADGALWGKPSLGKPQAPMQAIPVPADDGTDAAAISAVTLPTVPIPLTNATSYIMDGANSQISPTREMLYNMRIKSDQTALTDYLQIAYMFNLPDQKFKPTQILKYVNIGTANPPYFVKNVPASVSLKSGSTTMNMGTTYSLTTTASSTFTMSLTAGDVVSFYFERQSDDYQFTVVDPYGQKIEDFPLPRQVGTITGAIPILATGTYKILVHPLDNPSLTFSMLFLNANRQALQSRANGSTISGTFTTNIRDYAKYAITLNEGQYLSLKQPAAQIRYILMDNRGAIVESTVGLPLLFQALSTATYYLFIDNENGWGGSYNSPVTIK